MRATNSDDTLFTIDLPLTTITYDAAPMSCGEQVRPESSADADMASKPHTRRAFPSTSLSGQQNV
jgi:hypothetical protein